MSWPSDLTQINTRFDEKDTTYKTSVKLQKKKKHERQIVGRTNNKKNKKRLGNF